MKKSGLVLGCMLLASTMAPLVHAVDGVTLEIGRSSESANTYRLAAQFDFGQTIWQTDTGYTRLSGFWDAGVTRWSGLGATSVGVSPVLVLTFGEDEGTVTPYFEAGIGAAYFTSTSLGDRNLGSAFQFEDRIGAGLRFAGGTEVGVRLYHYSNAGIKSPNNGIETLALHYRMDI